MGPTAQGLSSLRSGYQLRHRLIWSFQAHSSDGGSQFLAVVELRSLLEGLFTGDHFQLIQAACRSWPERGDLEKSILFTLILLIYYMNIIFNIFY